MTALRLSGVTLPARAYPKKKNFVVPAFPVTRGLVGLYVFGANEAFSLMNHANSNLPLLKVGSPVINDLGATLSQGSCFDTQIAGSALGSQTILTVAKPVLATSSPTGALMVSNYMAGSPSIGDTLGFIATNSATALTGIATGTTTSAQTIAAFNPANWNSFAARMKSTGAGKVFAQAGGVLSAGAEGATGARSTQARTMRIGGHYTAGSFSANVNMQVVAIFADEHTDAEIAQNLAYLYSTYGPAIGVSTL